MRVPAALERLRPWWPHLRAAFVSFHLLAIVLSAIPAPAGGMNRRNWKDPTVQGEFRAWGARLGVSPETLEEALYGFAKGWMRARRLWLAPVRPYLDATGTDQPWRMFVAPHRHPARFRVEVQDEPAGEWEILFEESSRDARWRREFFLEERTRSVLFRYSWPEYSYEGRQLCQWLAGEIFAERASAQRVRCRYWKAASPSPEEVSAGVEIPGSFVATKIVPRREREKRQRSRR